MRYSFYQSTDRESSAFSTIFGDLVFGLLFVFFLLAIALVFNQPEVGAFASELEALEKRLGQEEKHLGAVERELQALQKLGAKTLEENDDRDRRIREREAALEAQKAETQSRVQSLRQAILKLEKAVETWTQRYNQLATSFNNLVESQSKDRDELRRELQRQKNLAASLTKRVSQAREQNALLLADIQRAARTTAEIDAIVGTFKKLLRQGGYPEILAEVEGVEESVHDLRDMRKPQSELASLKPLRLLAEYDTENRVFFVQVMEGNTTVDAYAEQTMDQVLRIAEHLVQTYERLSSGYTDKERKEYQPRAILRIPHATPYREVEEILRDLRNIIPVTIAS